MKRTIAAGLSAALLCGMVVPAFAADTKTATNATGNHPDPADGAGQADV